MAKLKKPLSGMEEAIKKEKEFCAAVGESTENLDAVIAEVENPEPTPVEKLVKLVPSYKVNKKELDHYKKLADKENAEIKQIMLEENLEEFSSGGVRVTCTVATKQSFIEEALIKKIKGLKMKGIIKKREYVDMDALEAAIYNGEINAAALASCQEEKEVVTLRIK